MNDQSLLQIIQSEEINHFKSPQSWWRFK